MNPYQPGEDNQDPYEVGYKAGAASRDAEIAELRSELETEQMRNVACGVVAIADTPDSAKQARDMHPDYMSAACQDVARRVDECIKLREQVKMLREALEHSVLYVPDLATVPGIAAALAKVRKP